MSDEADAARDAADSTAGSALSRALSQEGVIMVRTRGGEPVDELAAAHLVETLGHLIGAAVPAVPPRFPAEPPPGTVLRFERTVEDEVSTTVYRGRGVRVVERSCTWVAFRTGRRRKAWFLTGVRGREAVDWPDLVEMIGTTAPCEIATRWADVPALDTGDPEAPMDAAAYAAKYFGGETALIPDEGALGWRPSEGQGQDRGEGGSPPG